MTYAGGLQTTWEAIRTDVNVYFVQWGCPPAWFKPQCAKGLVHTQTTDIYNVQWCRPPARFKRQCASSLFHTQTTGTEDAALFNTR